MTLRGRLFFLIILSLAGQLGLIAAFIYEERVRSIAQDQLEILSGNVDRIRDFSSEFSLMSRKGWAAAVAGSAAQLKTLLVAGRQQRLDLAAFGSYQMAPTVRSGFDDYLASLDFLGSNNFSSRALEDLKRDEVYVVGGLEALQKEAAAGLLWARQDWAQDLGRRRRLAFAFLGFYWLSFCCLAFWWMADLKEAFNFIDEALRRWADGKEPWPQAEPAAPGAPLPGGQGPLERQRRVGPVALIRPLAKKRRDEIGRVLSAMNRSYHESRRVEAVMVHWDRLAAMGQLAGGVAHEINNPLTGVLGQAGLLLKKIPKEDLARKHVERISEAAKRCQKIVRNLLSFARQGEREMGPAQALEILASVLDIIGSDLEKANIEIIKEIQTDLPLIEASAVGLGEVFLNLILNAKDAMPSGGKLFVRLGEDSGWLRVEFEDTGEGMNREVLQRAFEAFYTTKEMGRGTGLGLSVSYGIIKEHGGKITAQSQGAGKGAKFTILLPVLKTD